MELEKRRLKISEGIQEDLQRVSDVFGISEHIIEGIAVYHGIENIKKSFKPQFAGRKVKEKNRSEFPISLSSELWNDFDDWRQKINLPSWEFMEILLNVELAKYRRIFEMAEESGISDKKLLLKLSERENDIKEKIGADKNELDKYFLQNAFIEEENSCMSEYFIPFDADINEEIKILNLNPLKAMTFSAFLLKYKCRNGNYKD